MVYSNAKEAAESLRMIWQGHDELNESLCVKGACNLYSILTGDNYIDESVLIDSAKLLKESYWLADVAETFQGSDSKKEDDIYESAGALMEQSRRKVGLESDSVIYMVQWWKAYRHKDNEAVFDNLLSEHLVQFNKKDESVAKVCVKLLIDAARNGHDDNDWSYVDNTLEKYFEIYLPQVLEKSQIK